MQPPSKQAEKQAAEKAAPPAFSEGAAETSEDFNALIARSGIRNTQQRRYVYEALMERRDHPTAQDIFMRVKAKVPSISLATVYNCLETLTESGLIKHVNLDRAPSRYCQNPVPHGHFFCNDCGAVTDVPLRSLGGEANGATTSGNIGNIGLWDTPAGAVVSHAEITLRGLCADCAAKAAQPSSISPRPL